MRLLSAILVSLSLAAGLELPLLAGSTSDNLNRLVTRVEGLVDGLSERDLAKLQSSTEEAVEQGRKRMTLVVRFARANQRMLELLAGGLLVFWGKNVMHLLLFLQTFRLSGWAPFQRAAVELRARAPPLHTVHALTNERCRTRRASPLPHPIHAPAERLCQRDDDNQARGAQPARGARRAARPPAQAGLLRGRAD